MEIRVTADMGGEDVSPETYSNVVEFALIGTRDAGGFPSAIRRSHLQRTAEPFDLIEKLEGVKSQLIYYACRIEKS